MIGKYGLICHNQGMCQIEFRKISNDHTFSQEENCNEIRKLITLSLAVVIMLDKNEKKQQQQTPSRA